MVARSNASLPLPCIEDVAVSNILAAEISDRGRKSQQNSLSRSTRKTSYTSWPMLANDQTAMNPKVAVVTAAGRGIGAACARKLAKDGYKVALMSRSEDAANLAQELGGVGLRGSVAANEDLQRLVTLTMET
jgi:D-arabinose 1-dehydrogenase-like Zn-dependent alcohol dehydrogenase